MKTFEQIKESVGLLSESGKPDKWNLELLAANAGRKKGDKVIDSKGKEIEDSVILLAKANVLRMAVKNSRDWDITVISKSTNKIYGLEIGHDELALLR